MFRKNKYYYASNLYSPPYDLHESQIKLEGEIQTPTLTRASREPSFHNHQGPTFDPINNNYMLKRYALHIISACCSLLCYSVMASVVLGGQIPMTSNKIHCILARKLVLLPNPPCHLAELPSQRVGQSVSLPLQQREQQCCLSASLVWKPNLQCGQW